MLPRSQNNRELPPITDRGRHYIAHARMNNTVMSDYNNNNYYNNNNEKHVHARRGLIINHSMVYLIIYKKPYRSARNNCGYKTLRFLHFWVIFFKMRFLIMLFSSQTRFKKELYEISAVLNYAIVQQLAFFAFVCITQLFLALRYTLSFSTSVFIFSTYGLGP